MPTALQATPQCTLCGLLSVVLITQLGTGRCALLLFRCYSDETQWTHYKPFINGAPFHSQSVIWILSYQFMPAMKKIKHAKKNNALLLLCGPRFFMTLELNVCEKQAPRNRKTSKGTGLLQSPLEAKRPLRVGSCPS